MADSPRGVDSFTQAKARYGSACEIRDGKKSYGNASNQEEYPSIFGGLETSAATSTVKGRNLRLNLPKINTQSQVSLKKGITNRTAMNRHQMKFGSVDLSIA